MFQIQETFCKCSCTHPLRDSSWLSMSPDRSWPISGWGCRRRRGGNQQAGLAGDGIT